MARMTDQEKKWQSEMDAQTLAEAKVIEGDKGRLSRAQSAAKTIATEAKERANAMSSVAGSRSSSNKPSRPAPKRSAPKTPGSSLIPQIPKGKGR